MLEDIYREHDGLCPVFVRGDANSSSKNTFRSPLLEHFLLKHDLQRVFIEHKTYHHFLGGGQFDSDLDVLLHSKIEGVSELLKQVICKHEHPLVDSSHDVILSSFTLPPAQEVNQVKPMFVAPKVPNKRMKVIWSEDGIENYKSAVGQGLLKLRETHSGPLTAPLMSAMLSSTYTLLANAAASTNRTINLGEHCRPPPVKTPTIARLQRSLLSAHREVARLSTSNTSLELGS